MANEIVEEAALIISELASNAVMHAQTAFKVTISRSEGEEGFPLVISVLDHAPDTPEPTVLRNHGLGVVSSLWPRWGITRRDDSKVVWAELDRGTRPAMRLDAAWIG